MHLSLVTTRAVPDNQSTNNPSIADCLCEIADVCSRPPYNQPSPVPAGYEWASLTKKDGDELFDHYRHTLEELGKQKGLLGLIFTKSQNKFQDPAKLRRPVINLIDKKQ
jgi:type I restriction enzyme M protein